MAQDEIPEGVMADIEAKSAKSAAEKARVARWDLNVAVFLFAVLIIVIILLFQGIGLEVVAPVAVFGLSMVWLVGWKRGRELYRDFYEEELAGRVLEYEKQKRLERAEAGGQTIEETIEERVQKALRERWR